MGVRVDLIDRSVYGSFGSSETHRERSQKINEDRNSSSVVEARANAVNEFNERDKFLLSDKDSLPQIRPKPN